VPLRGVLCSASQTTGTEHTDPLAHRAPVECPPSADPVKGKDAKKSRELQLLITRNRLTMIQMTYHVGYIVQPGDPQPVLGRDTSDGEDSGTVNGDTSNPDPLLQNLKPYDQLYTTAGVKFARSDTCKHREIALLLRGFSLEVDNISDILKFCLGSPFVDSTFAT